MHSNSADENYYQLLFEVTPLPLIVYELSEYKIIAVNQAAIETYGYSREEFLQLTIANIISREEFHDLKHRLAKDPQMQRQRMISVHRKKNGDWLNVELHAYTIRLQEKLARLVIINDVSAHLHNEEQLRSAREFYKLLFEKSPIPGWVYDQESLIFLDVNQAAVENYGYSREEFLRMTIKEIRPPDEIDRLLSEIEKALPNEKIDRVWRHRKKDGTLITVEVSVHPITYKQRNAVIVTAQDISARREMELALRESEEHYRTLYEKANDAFYALDIDCNFTSLNEFGEKYLGVSRAKILGKSAQTIVPEQDWPLVQKALQQIFNGELTSSVFEMRLVSKDGKILPTEVSTNAIFHNGKVTGIQGIARDLRRRNYLEQQLRESQKMEAIGRLAGRMAHDFNNLLTVVLGYSQLLLRRTPRDDDRYHLIEQIKYAGESAADFTSKLLVLGRQQITQLQVLDLNETVLRMGNILRSALGENIELNLEFGTSNGFVKADNTQLDHALMNLVLNARDAMPEGGDLTISTATLEVGTARSAVSENVPPGKYVCLSVRDTGIGMNEETRAHLFEPFFTTKEKGKGTGLGLFNVQKLVKQFGGHIEVTSQVGNGSAFSIYLPQMTDPAPARIPTENPSLSEKQAGTILLVEDEDSVRNLLEEILSEVGYEIFAASSGSQALEIVANAIHPIDIVLTDIRMPKMNGRELVEKLQRDFGLQRIIFMSGYTDDAEIVNELIKNPAAFLQKPFSRETLLNKIQEALS